jgi:ATP-dependent helicase YprA (DUF1998 family)
MTVTTSPSSPSSPPSVAGGSGIGLQGYGAERVVNTLRRTLQDYIEAQYHVRHDSLIEERRRLLESPSVIHQRPYVEATPVYEPGTPYGSLNIPEIVRRLLTDLSRLQPSVGIYATPYTHQSRALEAFLGAGDDLVIATGTGSGKTESFLMPILGALALEATERPRAAALPGCRALLLYPMNALVNDQLARIRKIFGDERVASVLRQGRGRTVQFGSYTGRTPYPGRRSAARDARYLKPMFEEFYLKYAEDAGARATLEKKGRWPSKDVVAFYGADKAKPVVRPNGQTRTEHHWRERLLTQPGDRELLTRHEMQVRCPDLLITNYSMLEYMLMRPLESILFEQTQAWLESDEQNQFIVVLDEAHMYRGAAGAEVALLLRRLQGRLGVRRDRVRYILTSASLGEGESARAAVVQFARDLTGISSSSSRVMRLVPGTREVRNGARDGTAAEADALAAFDLPTFQNFHLDDAAAVAAVGALAIALGWEAPPTNPMDLGTYLFDRLTGFGPMESLINQVSGQAVELDSLGGTLFPGADESRRTRAMEALLALGTFARRKTDDRVLLPGRLHLFYRGVPALYACVNPACNVRLDSIGAGGEAILGRLHTQPATHCSCTARGRVYELLTHRDCGSAFLRGYISSHEGDFLWHEPSAHVGADEAPPLVEVHLLVERSPHHSESHEAADAWIDVATGRIVRELPGDPSKFLTAYLPTSAVTIADGRPRLSFPRCPVCTRGWRGGRTKIMDLATKGEQPFANLVKAQVIAQPPQEPESERFPNGGRKSLLFSDGRQKAARLARDIPREVELDSFRQALALAVQLLGTIPRDAKLTRDLYRAFVAVVAKYHLQLFDREDQETLRTHVRYFHLHYGGDLAAALEDNWDVTPPARYAEALLRQLCSAFYSLPSATIGYVVPSKFASRPLLEAMRSVAPALNDERALELAIAWCAELLGDYAFDKDISASARRAAAGYTRPGWGSDGKFTSALKAILATELALGTRDIGRLEDVLRERLCQQTAGLYFLDPNRLSLAIDLTRSWSQCDDCTHIAPTTVAGRCANCGGAHVEDLDPQTSEYIRARKGFWRQPVADALSGRRRPVHIVAEEHTAQLSQRDAGNVYATTEKYELRFQDVVLDGEGGGPIDVLSCTTTMEVGVDIGSLIAVGLRNVPPQRENYQQRAGRAGRRGAAVSTVITYAQGGPHDSYYFHHPREIVAGKLRLPVVHVANPKIARRHVHAFLLQTFFLEAARVAGTGARTSAVLHEALGATRDFFASAAGSGPNLGGFDAWVRRRVLAREADLLPLIVEWLPEAIAPDRAAWVRSQAEALLARLYALQRAISDGAVRVTSATGAEEGEAADEEEGNGERRRGAPGTSSEVPGRTEGAANDPWADHDAHLLNFLFTHGLLPSYAFPTDLCDFLVERMTRKDGRWQVVVNERPQLGVGQALSEYAPGRLVVIDKKTYRSGGVTAFAVPTERDRAAALFATSVRPYVYCARCSFVQEPPTGHTTAAQSVPAECPVCGEPDVRVQDMLTPEVFTPEGGKAIDETDRDQEYTYATSAQFPTPVGAEDLGDWSPVGARARMTHAADRRLVIVNKGRAGDDAGFDVCEKCGAAAPAGTGQVRAARHQRPYIVDWGREGQPPDCAGSYRRVFLGTAFQSDLLIVRLGLGSEVATNLSASVVRSALEDALRTLSEGFVLAASKHLDIDPGEFSAGYRMVPGLEEGDELAADLYLFDTLAGGAGYADEAGRSIRLILERTLTELEGCPARCDRSCYNCLRHYKNQYWHEHLDRHLAATLLRYALFGALPPTEDLESQVAQLQALRRMLELDGYSCESATTMDGILAPLRVTTSDTTVVVGTYNGLLDRENANFRHPLLDAFDARDDVRVKLLNHHLVDRNLPAAYEQVKVALAH